MILVPRTVPNVSGLHVLDSGWRLGGHPQWLELNKRLKGLTTDSGAGKRSQAKLSLLEDIDSSTRGFCAILSRDLLAHEKSILHIWKASGVMEQLKPGFH